MKLFTVKKKYVGWAFCSDVTESFAPFHYYQLYLLDLHNEERCLFIGHDPLVATEIVSCDSDVPSQRDMARLKRMILAFSSVTADEV